MFSFLISCKNKDVRTDNFRHYLDTNYKIDIADSTHYYLVITTFGGCESCITTLLDSVKSKDILFNTTVIISSSGINKNMDLELLANKPNIMWEKRSEVSRSKIGIKSPTLLITQYQRIIDIIHIKPSNIDSVFILLNF